MTDPRALPTDRMDAKYRNRVRLASFKAKRAYPGPVGEWLERELLEWEQFGYRFGSHSMVTRIVNDVLAKVGEEGLAA